MWSEAYEDWMGGKEPDPADYAEEDYQKFQEIISGEEQE